jgi:hypothetical protein
MVTVRYRFSMAEAWEAKVVNSLEAAYDWLATQPETLAWVIES